MTIANTSASSPADGAECLFGRLGAALIALAIFGVAMAPRRVRFPGNAPTSPKTRNVVFVHGLFADGSCRSKVIARLRQIGVNCANVQNLPGSCRSIP
jgi:hypothetical protein